MSSFMTLNPIRDLEITPTSLLASSKLVSDSTWKAQQIASFVFSNINSYCTAARTQVIHITSSFKYNTYSTTEVSRICLRALAGYTFAGGLLAIGPSTLAFVVAAPFFLLSGGLWHYSHTLIDYDNPKEIEKIHTAALKMPFIEALNTHSFQQIVTYGILSPEEFFISCKQCMEELSFVEILSLHQKLKESYKAYPILTYLDKIPDPALWKEKFTNELSIKTPLEILATYSIEQLKEFNLLPEEEIVRFEQIEKVLEKQSQAQETRRTSLIAHLNNLQTKIVETVAKQHEDLRKSFEKKTGIINQWLGTKVLPSFETIAKTFSTQEIEGLEDNLTAYGIEEKQFQDELNALGANTLMLPPSNPVPAPILNPTPDLTSNPSSGFTLD